MSFGRPQPGRPGAGGLPLVLSGAAAVVVAWLAWDRFGPERVHGDATPRPVVARGELAAFEQLAIEIFRENAPSVVHVGSRARTWLGHVSEGSGTGFVWDARGYVVTNYHVVQTLGSEVVVRFPGGATHRAVVVGGDPRVDVAVVKVVDPPENLRPVIVGSSKDLLVGQAVFAIGNPFGLDHTLTTGVVSALDRVIDSVARTPIQGVIQVDAAINPGNSGGPLLDSAGRLIGMNTAIYSPSGASAGIGFAVPVDTINRVVPRLIEGTQGTGPALGVVLASAFRYGQNRYPVVGAVAENSGAEEAGLRPGDVILGIDGIPVTSMEDIPAILDQKEIGESVELDILRDEGTGMRRRTVEVVLKTERPR